MLTLGLLDGEIGRASASIRSLLTVHSMVAQTIARWGSAEQREHWLRALATGRRLRLVRTGCRKRHWPRVDPGHPRWRLVRIV